MPDVGAEVELLRRMGIPPYMLTDLRSEGNRGSRDCTAEGRSEYNIECDFVGDPKSAESGRGWDALRGDISSNLLRKYWGLCEDKI